MFYDFLLLKFYLSHFDRERSFMLRENIILYVKQITRVFLSLLRKLNILLQFLLSTQYIIFHLFLLSI